MSTSQHRFRYRDRAYAADRRQKIGTNQRPVSQRVADFVDGSTHTTAVLSSWMRLIGVGWNASNRRRPRHNQQHDSVSCRWRPVDKNHKSGCRQRLKAQMTCLRGGYTQKVAKRQPPILPIKHKHWDQCIFYGNMFG